MFYGVVAMPDQRRYLYWDASIFLHYLGEDRDMLRTLDRIVEAVESSGSMRIATSVLSVTEVAFALREQRSSALSSAFEARLDALWSDVDSVHLASFDVAIARLARTLIRAAVGDGRSLKPIDAVHLATASSVGAEFLLTTDQRLIKRGREAGIAIGMPDAAALAVLLR